MRKLFLLLIASAVTFSSCRLINPEQMLRTPTNYNYSSFNDAEPVKEYRLAANDELYFRLYTNDGEKLVDPIDPFMEQQKQQHTYIVEYDGLVKFPVLGRVNIEGMTIREAEKHLEDRYSEYYNKPFVSLKVVNNRVIVFPGGRGGSAKVIPLENSNTTLFEALALAGGIDDGKAHKVKLIRGDLNNPEVYLINLSTIDGVKNANMVLQANDIIYVQPRAKVPQRILENVTPYLTLLTSALLVYSLFR
ncbi:MAG: polysaccharide biosynthesis/export family protein [Bacteroidetes bacterium]|nr:polysaccharide biosynthesis/export family protein [Bacteroidota bacterium]